MLVSFLIGLSVLAAAIFGPHDGQLNLRTGELRYRVCWIPMQYSPMQRNQQDWESLGMPNQWWTVVTYPLPGSNNPDLMIRDFTAGIAIWVRYDRSAATSMAHDLCGYIEQTHGERGLPRYCSCYEMGVVDERAGTLRADRSLEWQCLCSNDPVLRKVYEILHALSEREVAREEAEEKPME